MTTSGSIKAWCIDGGERWLTDVATYDDLYVELLAAGHAFEDGRLYLTVDTVRKMATGGEG